MITSAARRRVANAAIRSLARLLVRVFFAEVVVTGRAEMPRRHPVVVVANHPSGLVDALVLIATSDRFPRFLGKSTLWRILPLRPFLALAGVVPVQRASDTSASLSETQRRIANNAAFARCRQVLASGAVVAVFPEGISHDEPSLQGVRTGAARIALGAASEDRVAKVQLVAAGIVYDDKARFRSRAMIHLLPPRPIDPYVAEFRRDAGRAIERLTTDMAHDLRRATPDYPSRAVADEMLAIADVVGRRPGVPASLAERQRVAATLAQLGDTEAGRHPVRELRAQVAEYRIALAALGLDDADLINGSLVRHSTQVGWDSLKMVVAAPVAVVGVAIHAVPFTLIKMAGRLPRQQSMKATVKLLGSFALYTLWYVALAGAVARRRGWRAGAGALVVAPASGWVALLSGERRARMNGLRRAASARRHHRAAIADVVAARSAIADEARRLLGLE